MTMTVEKISAVTFRVFNMKVSVQFYRGVLGMEVLDGGEDAPFSSLRAKDAECPILNLEQGRSVPGWGRMIFYVADVDAFWERLRGKGLQPERPRDASWGERYFHMPDPDGHELSFARPI
jgi:catechol 2,3-dioxygenase-like lactoylglutathione lyase family enzyme